MSSSYAKCPECSAVNPLLTPYYKCYSCSYLGEENRRSNKYEKEQRKVAGKIVRKLLPKTKFKLRFPGKTDTPNTYGWTIKRKDKYVISIPRKTFYLPNDEFVDTVVHEPAHASTWDWEHKNPDIFDFGHGRKFYFKYRDNRKKIFQAKEFKDFINSPNPQQKFNKGYGKIYPSIYEVKYDDEEDD